MGDSFGPCSREGVDVRDSFGPCFCEGVDVGDSFGPCSHEREDVEDSTSMLSCGGFIENLCFCGVNTDFCGIFS